MATAMMSAMLLYISSHNYPGGETLNRLHTLKSEGGGCRGEEETNKSIGCDPFNGSIIASIFQLVNGSLVIQL